MIQVRPGRIAQFYAFGDQRSSLPRDVSAFTRRETSAQASAMRSHERGDLEALELPPDQSSDDAQSGGSDVEEEARRPTAEEAAC